MNQKSLRLLAALGWLIWLICAAAAESTTVPDPAVVAVRGLRLEPICRAGICSREWVPFCRGSAVCFDTGGRSGQKPSGYLFLTAKHVVNNQPADRYQVFASGKWRDCLPRPHCSKYDDLGWLGVEMPGDQDMVCLATENAAVGDSVRIAGFQLGLDYRSQRGTVVEAPAFNAQPSSLNAPLVHWVELESQGAVIQGQSGGVVFNAAGDVCGVLILQNADQPWKAGYVPVSRIRAWFDREVGRSGLPPANSAEVPRRLPVEPPLAPVPTPVSPTPTSPAAGVEKNLPNNPQKSIEPPESGLTDTGNHLAEAGSASPVTRGNKWGGEVNHGGTEARRDEGVSVSPRKAWWDVALSGAGLAAVVAGAVATGGLSVWSVGLPAMKFVRSVREVVASHRSVLGPRGQGLGPESIGPPAIGPRPSPLGPAASAPEVALAAPFPRKLDEARQLLELGAIEGRVPLLDGLRGMFLDDECDKVLAAGEPAAMNVVSELRKAIQSRVDAAAPLSVKV